MIFPNVAVITLLLILTVNAFPQLTVRTIGGMTVEPDKPKMIYDTLSNIKYHENLNEYTIYVGQKILFYPRNSDSNLKTSYYGNFYRTKLYTLENEIPDTIWYKHRKKIQPNDFKLKYPSSDRYKPTLVKNERVSFGNNWLGFSSKDTLKNGYFTPANEIEGKIFKIIDFRIKKDNYHSGQEKSYYDVHQCLLFTLLSENNDTVLWQSDVIYKKDHFFPAIIVSYYERIRALYIGNLFQLNPTYSFDGYYASNINKGGKYSEIKGELKCVDMSLIGKKNEFTIPMLVFENELKELLSINITNFPSLVGYLDMGFDSGVLKEDNRIGIYGENAKFKFINDTIPSNKSFYYECSVDRLIDSRIIKDNQRLAAEKKIAEEKLEQLENKRIAKETEVRHNILVKKYGKHIADLIIKGFVETGMTKKMCIESWGEPDDINKTSGSFGVHEQWVYGSGSYLYFENGKLTTIQN